MLDERDTASTAEVHHRKRFKISFRQIGKWITNHKLITILIAVLLVLFLEYFSLPSVTEIAHLQKVNPRTTALIEQRRKEAQEKKKLLIIRQQWVPLSQMSEHIKHAVIIAEDGTFFEHEGVDWYEVKESIKKDIEKGKFARGASTITQQVAKNLYLSTSKDPIRKLKELIITTVIESELSKDRILEVYLNIIEWGEGIFGIEAASLSYFGKHASELTREDASRLAAIIPNPLKHKPNSETRYVTFRKNIILDRMEARGW